MPGSSTPSPSSANCARATTAASLWRARWDMAYMGTRFIATQEANADPRFKQMILDAESTDVVYTHKVTGMGASFLRSSLERSGMDWGEGAPTPVPDVEHEEKMIAWRDIWSAGQGVGLIDDVPTVAELACRLKAEYAAAVDVAKPANARIGSHASTAMNAV